MHILCVFTVLWAIAPLRTSDESEVTIAKLLRRTFTHSRWVFDRRGHVYRSSETNMHPIRVPGSLHRVMA